MTLRVGTGLRSAKLALNLKGAPFKEHDRVYNPYNEVYSGPFAQAPCPRADPAADSPNPSRCAVVSKSGQVSPEGIRISSITDIQ